VDYQVLVAYATKHGATAVIARQIGEVLREAGLQTDVLPVQDVGDVTAYDAVVLGSAIYIGRWRKEAVRFLEANERALAERKVWLFSSGPTGKGDAAELVEGRLVPEGLQPLVDNIKPQRIAVFHGVLIRDQLNFIERLMIRLVKAPFGDFRDWDAIVAWAAGIADALKEGAD